MTTGLTVLNFVCRLFICLLSDQTVVPVELTGSPIRKTYQTSGVYYAVNLGGPTYESTEKVVFDDTQSLFEYDPVQGEIYSQSL